MQRSFSPDRIIYGFLTLLAVSTVSGLYSKSQDDNYTRRIADLRSIRAALHAYKLDNGRFPVTPQGSVSIGDASQPNPKKWLPGLVPQYLDVVPRDPRGLAEASKQYLYLSDGQDYKLIAHGAEDAKAANGYRPDMMDPRRPDWAYGFWTSGAKAW